MNQIKQVSTAAINKSDSLKNSVEVYPASSFSLLFLILKSWISLNKKANTIQRTVNSFYSAIIVPARFENDTVHISAKENLTIQYPYLAG